MGKSNERVSCKLRKSKNFKIVFNHSCCHGNYGKLKFHQSVFHQYIFEQFITFSLWAATFPCHDLAKQVYSQTSKTVFSYLKQNFSERTAKKPKNTNWVIEVYYQSIHYLLPCFQCWCQMTNRGQLPLNKYLNTLKDLVPCDGFFSF